ncbi:MAG TPA: tetratricopeptide repeat protein [Gallionella sp.]|nr:tetratricopeptide repeat protein [Gallionella sp.]
MSLLLDARKKSQLALSAQGDERIQTAPDNNNRSAGQNLFNAKSPLNRIAGFGMQRNLLLALGGTALLLVGGAVYLWHLGSSSSTRPLQPNTASQPVAASPQPASAATPPAPVAALAAPADTKTRAPISPAAIAPTESAPLPLAPARKAIRIERQSAERIDPAPDNAYRAYRDGKLDEAQQLYRELLGKDAHNTGALLGLAAIAQQLGEETLAAQYYADVLRLDPRNATANAGMAALNADENSESRLKTLLGEQPDSAALHFALGNLYAGQARWGEAQQAYFNASALEPDNAEFAFNLAVSLDHLGQSKLAAQQYRRALQLDGQNRAGFDHAQTEQRLQALTR